VLCGLHRTIVIPTPPFHILKRKWANLIAIVNVANSSSTGAWKRVMKCGVMTENVLGSCTILSVIEARPS